MIRKLLNPALFLLGCALSVATVEAQVWSQLSAQSMNLRVQSVTNRPAARPGGSDLLDQLDVYASGSDGTVWVNAQVYSCRYRSGHPLCSFFFTGWKSLGAVFKPGATNVYSYPYAVGWSGHREVFALGSDQQLWHTWADGDNTTWSGWFSLGGPSGGNFCQQPRAVSSAPGRVDLFGLGCDGQLWHTFSSGHGWTTWTSILSGVDINHLDTAAAAATGSFLLGLTSGGNAATVSCDDGVCGAGGWAFHNLGFQGCTEGADASPATMVGALPAALPSYAVIVGGTPGVDCYQQLFGWWSFGGSVAPVLSTAANPLWVGQAIPVTSKSSGATESEVFYTDLSYHVDYQRFNSQGWDTAFGVKMAGGAGVLASSPKAVPGVGRGSAYVFADSIGGNYQYTIYYTYVQD